MREVRRRKPLKVSFFGGLFVALAGKVSYFPAIFSVGGGR
jgi:hypothetical protein